MRSDKKFLSSCKPTYPPKVFLGGANGSIAPP